MRESIKAFDRVAHVYDEWYLHPQGRQILRAELDAVDSLIPASGLGLEVGAGTGIFAENLTREDRVIVCLDPSPGMLARAKERKTPAILGVGDHLSLRAGLVDFTYMVTVLEFLVDPLQVLGQVRRVAKQGAPITALFINAESAWGELYKLIGSKGDPVFSKARLLTLSEAHELFGEAGYLIRGSVGTLTTGPAEATVGGGLEEPGPETGVIVVRATPT